MFLGEKNKIRVFLTTIMMILVAGFVFGFRVFAQENNFYRDGLLDVSAYILNQENKEIPNGKYKIRFAIYSIDRNESDDYPSDSDENFRIWEEEQEIEVTNGLFNAYLGSVNPIPRNINLANGNYYLGIRVGEDSETVPRKKIGYFPSALYSLNSENAANAENAVNSSFVNGSKVGTEEGDILQLGPGGQIEIERLPVGEDEDSLVLGNDERLHDQNSDTGTNSTEFNIGSGSGTGENFDITVSNASNKPTIRFDGLTQEWQYSSDGINFSSLSFDASDYLSLSGGTMTGEINFSADQTFGGATLTELGYLSGVTSSLQDQINNRALLSHTHDASDVVSGVFDINRGGTGLSNIPLGSILFADAEDNLSAFTGTSLDDENFLRFNWNGGDPYLSWSSTSVLGGFAYFTVSGDSGTSQTVIDQNDVKILGGNNLSTVAGDTDTITVNMDSTLSGVTWNGNDIDVSDYTNLGVGGVLMNLSGDIVSLREGTMTSGRLCSFVSGTGLVCDTDSATVGHSALTVGVPANGLSVNGSQVLSLALASGTTTGALSSADWNTFNNKQNALVIGNIVGTANQVSVTGGTGAVIGGGVTLSLPQNIATTSTPTFAGLTLNGNLGIREGGIAPSFYTYFQGGDQAGNITYTLPTGQAGGSNYVLSNNGSGALSWQPVSSIGGTTGTGVSGQVTYWTGTGTLTGENQLSVSRGGTGVDGSTVTNGQILIGNDAGNNFSLSTLTQGDGIIITNGAGNISIASTLGTSVDISSETNLQGDTEIVLTGDSLSIAQSIARDTELHSPVTLAGQNYLTLIGQQITANQINLASQVTGTLPVANGGTGLTGYGSTNQILGMNAAGTALEYKTISGTTDQITLTNAANSLTFSLPQDIATTSAPIFGGLTLNGNQTLNGTLAIQETGTAPSFYTTFQGGDQTGNITYTLPTAI
ncbi:MAG: hypothetical protein GX765_01580, partial [Candidatus Moranbacteria bacterium]|nr:hypothetical protein [Candidatus Moranbacteria bacterium]